MRRLFVILLLTLCLLPATPAVSADSLQLDYDATGQLLRLLPEQGDGVHFRHDAAGNITAVLHDPAAVAPEVSEQSVDRFRCGQATEVTVIGDGLEGARPDALDEALRISDFRYHDGALRFRVLASCDGMQGETAIRLRTASGTTLLPITVDPARPALIIRPSPMAVAPGGGLRHFEIALTHADSRPHDIALSIPDAEIAGLDSASGFTLQPGETRAHGVIRGHAPGTTVLTLQSPELGALSVPLLVTESAAGVNTLLALPLGLDLPPEPMAAPALTISLHRHLGLATGRGLLGVTPAVLNRDAGEQTLRLAMQGMAEITARVVHPGDGIEITGSRRLDAGTLELQLRIAQDAAVGLRQLRIADQHGLAPALRPGADRLLLAYGHPLLHSVSPNWLRPGDSGVLLTLRGEHLDDALRVFAEPAMGIEFGPPSVTDGGTRLQLLASVAASAEPGPRRLQVRTPAARSDDAASPANTLHLVTDPGSAVDNLSARALGLQRGGEEDSGSTDPRRLAGPAMGLVSGPHLMAIQPDVLVPGEVRSLTLFGQGFHAGHVPRLIPDQGLAELVLDGIAADGSTAELRIALQDDAILGTRRLRIADGHGTPLPPAKPGADRLRITPAGARIDSVSPLYLPRDDVTEVTLRGEGLQDVQAIVVQPADGVTAESAWIAGDGRLLRFRLAVSAAAETGPRRLQVETLDGAAVAASAASNTVYITDQGAQPALALNDALLGLYRPASPPDDAEAAMSMTELAPPLGMRRLSPDRQPTTASVQAVTAALGLARAPVVLDGVPAGLRPGDTTTLTLGGQGLDRTAAASVSPADGLTIHSLGVGADGASVDLEITVDADATAGMRRLLLHTDEGLRIPAVAAADRVAIGPGTPRIDSLTPILAGRGDAGVLLIRGERLQLVSELRLVGEPGLRLGAFWSSTPDGTELSVTYAVDPDAPLGQRIIQLSVPGDHSSAEASPANTFTVHDEVPD